MNRRQKRKETGRRPVRFAAGAMICLLAGTAVLAGGCGKSSVSLPLTGGSTVFKIGSEKCSEAEARVLLMNYQKENASLYGVELWSHDYGSGESLEDYVKDLTISQLAEVYTLDIIAEEEELALTEEETDEAEAAASEYIEGLSDAERDYLDISEGDVKKLFERFLLAKKQYTALTESISSEVSDDEARIMVMEKVTVADEETAQGIVSSLEAGNDFATAAASYADQAEAVHVSRTTYDEDVTEVLFDLETGETSDVLSVDGAYCVFYCESAFDAELTEQNKENVRKQRMEDVVDSTYATYTEQLSSRLNEDVWDKVSVDSSLTLDGASFLEVYEAHFDSFS